MQKKKIMVVDDAAIMRVVIKNMLSQDPNLEVSYFAANGKEALDKLDQVQPDLILLDIEMPEMDGLEFLCHARLKSKAKVVMLSAVAPGGSTRAAQARSLGADAIISKPSGAISFDLEDKRGSHIKRLIYSLLGIEG
jgi:chemotaxis response regulator CheB